MFWMIIEISVAMSILLLFAVYWFVTTETANLCPPETKKVEGRLISHSELLELFDKCSFTLNEQVHMVLIFLGERRSSLDLAVIYNTLSVTGTPSIKEVFDVGVTIEVLLRDISPAESALLKEVVNSINDGSFTNIIDTVDDIISSKIPHYVMRLD